MIRVFIKLVILLTVIFGQVSGSAGDRQEEFQACIRQEKCKSNNCISDLNVFLKLTGWSCLDNCKYTCMQYFSSIRSSQGLPLLQYYGKWPFTRILGIQEPASVMFSLGNMIAHLKGYKVLESFRESHLRNIYMNFARISILLWIASTIFHSRDFPITEKADYYMAIMGLEYSFFIATVKSWNLSLKSQKTLKRILSIYYIGHVLYLSFGAFDYSYNMIIGISFGFLTNLQWILWYFRVGIKTDYGLKQVAFVILITCAMCLEVFDFSPIFGILDAHSIWHLSTIPLVYLHYSFLKSDLKQEESIKNF